MRRVCGGDAVTPHAFITKWRASALKERSASQEHFIDLCHLLGEPTPAEADPSGETYCFERGVRKDTGGDGWADVWKRHHFAWEYKGRRANLDAAFDQPPAVFAGAGEPAAADRVRHGAVPDPHQLDEQRQPDARVRARRLGRRVDARPAEVGVFGSRSAAARGDPAVAHRACRGLVCGGCPSVARARARPAGGRALRQPARLLHVRRRCRPASGPHVHADAAACAARSGAIRRAGRRPVRGDGHWRPGRLRDGGCAKSSSSTTAGARSAAGRSGPRRLCCGRSCPRLAPIAQMPMREHPAGDSGGKVFEQPNHTHGAAPRCRGAPFRIP